jgi:nitrate reductase NapE component/glutaredoxin
MSKLRNKLIIYFLFLFFMIWPVGAAGTDQVNLYFFYGEGCPHCAKEEKFLQQLEKQIPRIKIYSFEIYHNQENAKFLAMLGQELGLDIQGVPLLIIGDKTFVGFYSAETTGSQIENIVEEYIASGCTDVVAQAVARFRAENQTPENAGSCESGELPDSINLPILGEVEVKNFSLPALTVLIAAIDGFNPCAMWVLLFLISLLLGMKDRKRMWILGSTFVIASGLAYFLFLSAWLNLFLFLGFVLWVRLGVGIVALGSGSYHLRDYYINREGGCKVTGTEKRKLVFEKIKAIIKTPKFWLAFIGIIALAFAVNLVELICSAGLPAVYTQVLSLSNLATWQYYLYLLLYIFIFMLDDLLVFVLAMATLRMQAISSQYTRWSGLVGGIIMIIIGLLLLFKPSWLMF